LFKEKPETRTEGKRKECINKRVTRETADEGFTIVTKMAERRDGKWDAVSKNEKRQESEQDEERGRAGNEHK